MFDPEAPADARDEQAADRDDFADGRDGTAQDRDRAAHRRDDDATERDERAGQHADDLVHRLQRTREQILDRLARIEEAVVDPDDWSGLTPDALARLDAHTAEQRRLARRDRVAVAALFDELRDELGHGREDRRAAADDRRTSAGDRRESAGDRRDSGQDRSDAARDRAQGAIERAQADPDDLPADGGRRAPGPEVDDPPPPGRPSVAAADRALAESQERISDSRARIERTRRS